MAVVVRLHPSALESTARKEACRRCVVHIDLGPARGRPPPRPWSRPHEDRALPRVARGGSRAAAGAPDACRRDVPRPGRPPPDHRRPRCGPRADRSGRSRFLEDHCGGGGRRSRTTDRPDHAAGDARAPIRSSARAPRVGVVAPATKRGDDIVGATPTGSISSRAGAARLSGDKAVRSRVRIARTRPRRARTRLRAGACRLSHEQRQVRVRIPSRSERPGSSTVEQLPVCVTTTAASSRNAPALTGLRAGVERLSGRAPGLGREARVRVPPS